MLKIDLSRAHVNYSTVSGHSKNTSNEVLTGVIIGSIFIAVISALLFIRSIPKIRKRVGKSKILIIMKKIVFVLFLIFILAKLNAQEYYDISFAGTGGIEPETILVENLTTGASLNMQGTDVLRLDIVQSSLNDIKFENNKLTIYPNPMDHSCNFEFINAQNGRVDIQLYSIEGKLIHKYNRELIQGKHNFLISGVASGTYLISVKTETENIAGRFVSTSTNNAVFSMTYNGATQLDEEKEIEMHFDDNNTKSTKAIVNMPFTLGDELKFVGSTEGYANSTIYSSPTSNQTYTFEWSNPFYRITGHTVTTNMPCFVDVMFSVTDENETGVDNLTNTDFIVKENDILVSPAESFRYVRSINTIPYEIKTVLMIDNSSSIVNELADIKQAALEMINNIGDNQEIAVYVFSDAPVLLQDFTSDIGLLTAAVNSISLGFPSTNLYGSYIAGVNAWDDVFTTELIQKGFLVLFTDGDDTQSSSTLQQAITARGQKSTYIIGLGDDLTPDILNQLANPAPYYSASSVDDLPEIFVDIQEDIYIYANSFYWLNYMTPKRGGLHTLKIEIANNENTGTDAHYEGQFNANGFESVTYGVYVNTTPEDLYGIDSVETDYINDFDLTAVTYWAYQPPVYTWSSDNTNIVTVTPSDEYFNRANLHFPGNEGGVAIVTVDDIANMYTKEITVYDENLPMLNASEATDITYTSAQIGAEVTFEGATSVTERGVCWSTTPQPTISDDIVTSGSGLGSFTANLTGLTNGTTYYIRAYAINSIGTSYSNQEEFNTLPAVLPTLTTTDAYSIMALSAQSGGNITDYGGSPVTERGVCWSTNSNPSLTDFYTTDGSGAGTFTSQINGLTENTTYYVRAYATNEVGTAYGNAISFTTRDGVCVLTTTDVSNIIDISGQSGGNVIDDGGDPVAERGVCWSTNQNPTISDAHTSDGTGTGSFTSTISDLTPLTTYYLRAYATNAVGTFYASQITFTTIALPTLTTNAATSITGTTAVSGGNVSNDGTSTVTARGICWSTSQNPTTANNIIPGGTGTGSFTSNMSGLSPNTTYHVRAYATNEAGTAYGSEINFTTPIIPPTVTTTAATSVSYTTAISGGNVTADGGSAVTARGICWSTSQNPTTANNTLPGGAGTGSFTSNITGLSDATIYYVRAYATNSAGTAYGNEISFTTNALTPPSLTTAAATSVSYTTAVSGGNVTADGGSAVTARGICWSTSQNPTTANNTIPSGTGTGSFASSITGLSDGTTYYVRAYATNSSGTTYGNEISFTTIAYTTPSLTTTTVTSITLNSAISGGNVTADGGSAVTSRGVCWSTSQNPTTSNNTLPGGTGTGSFTSNITGLSPGITYYLKAYATNSLGTAYGNQITFTTFIDACAGVTPPSGFGIVTSAGKCWLDRNLGASQVATSSTDAQAYGDLYQYGRGTDGHQIRTSNTTTTLSPTSTPSHGNFIINSAEPYDWMEPPVPLQDLWYWSALNNPCPSGWRVPSQQEWENEIDTWATQNLNGAYQSPLKLTRAGFRTNTGGTISTTNGTYATTDWGNSGQWCCLVKRCLRISTTSTGIVLYHHIAVGRSVRCIKQY